MWEWYKGLFLRKNGQQSRHIMMKTHVKSLQDNNRFQEVAKIHVEEGILKMFYFLL
jgi:hypothetical protein